MAVPGTFTDHVEEGVLKHLLGIGTGWSRPGNLYLALNIGGETGSGTEPLESRGYKRWPVKFYIKNPASNPNHVTRLFNTWYVQFGPAVVDDWTSFTQFSIMDSPTRGAGNAITWATLSTPHTLKTGQMYVFYPGQLQIDLTTPSQGGGTPRWSTYLQDKFARYIFLNEDFSTPDVYLALSKREPQPTDDGSDLQEPTSTYERVQISQWTGPSSATSPNNYSYSKNNNSETQYFTEAASKAGWYDDDKVQFCSLVDNENRNQGNLLAYGGISTPFVVEDDDRVFVSDQSEKIEVQVD